MKRQTHFQHPDCGFPIVATWAVGTLTFRHDAQSFQGTPEEIAALDAWCREHRRQGFTLQEAEEYLMSLGVARWEATDWETVG